MSRFKYWNILIPVVAAFAVFFGFLGIKSLMGQGENKTEIELYDGKNVRLVIGADLIALKNPPIIRDNEIAIDTDTVRTYFDPNLFWDPDTKKVTVTTKDRLIRMNTGNLETFVNDEEITLNLPAFEEAGTVYLPMKFLSEYYQINIHYNDVSMVVMIDEKNTVIQKAKIILDGAVIRNGRSIKEPIVKRYADINSPQELYVFEHYDNWYKVRSEEGVIGYIEKKFVSVSMYVHEVALRDTRDSIWKPDRGKISMVWEQVNAVNPNVGEIGEMPGLDVVSPTWFDLTGVDGEVGSKASAEYINWAHNKGYKVWALFRNNSNDIEMTSAFLNDGDARAKAIRSVLAYASMLEIDGINLDFENVYLKDKDMLTQFVRELAPMLREQGLTFSVCVNIPDGSDNWSKCFDSPRIAEAADYIVVMAYDQTGTSSNHAGSVAQLDWVETNIRKLVERDGIPPERVILGMPFYIRLWEMETDSDINGRILNTKAIYMRTAINLALDNHADIVWEERSGQFYCEYKSEGKIYRMWLEEPYSLNMKSSLVHKYNLAGISAWCREFEIPEAWDVINRNMKQIVSYIQWQDEAYVEEPRLERLRE